MSQDITAGIREIADITAQLTPSSPAVSAGSRPETAGGQTLTDPLIIAVGQELAMRVWDPPLPELPIEQWADIVAVIARCVRECEPRVPGDAA